MLVAHCGLNPMGGKCKAGMPVRNIQATLDNLTSVGLSVAIYEEITDVDSDKGPSKITTKIKHRALTQIVSPGSSTYTYDLCLRTDDIEYHENRPAIGIIGTTNGYNLCEIYIDEKSVIISDRLTEEGTYSTHPCDID